MVPTLFLQIFVLGVCVAGFATVVLSNLKLNLPKRLGLGIVMVGLAYFVAMALQKASTPAVAPPLTSNLLIKEPAPSSPSKHTAVPDQTTEKAAEGHGNVMPVSNHTETAASPDAEAAYSRGPTSDSLRVEVLYDGPTAAGGVINPRDIMSKELSEAGLEVALAGATPPPRPTLEPAPGAPEPPTVMPSKPAPASEKPTPTPQPPAPVTPPTANPSARPPMVPPSPSSPTVKEVFDFVRKAQQGEWINRPEPTGSFLSFSNPLYAASPPAQGFVVVAMRASIRHLNENQGIFSTEANMQIAAVTSDGKRIQSVVMMAGPETVRGFGLDWDRAEEAVLKDISAKMCPGFAKDLYQKLTGKK